MTKETITEDKVLSESQKLINEWNTGDLVDAKAAAVARIMETTNDVLKKSQGDGNVNLTESLSTVNNVTAGMDIVDPVLMTIVRRSQPNLMAYDVVGVQPMTGPTGQIFVLRGMYGNQNAGPHGRPGDARNPTGSTVNGSGLTPAQVNQQQGYATNEALYGEARTAHSGAGTQSANDGTVAYTAYDVATGMDTDAAEILGSDETGAAAWGTMSLQIEKTTVEAKTRALRTGFSVELAQDLRSVHGLDAESELINLLTTEIVAESNREMINTIRKVAKIGRAEKQYTNGVVDVDSNGAPVLGTAGLFDVSKQTNGRWDAERAAGLIKKIYVEANAIAKDTRRGRGNFIIVSSDVASFLGMTQKLLYTEALKTQLEVDDTGNTFVGVLDGSIKVYVDPYLGYDEVIVGYKGTSQFDAGIFYCPYVPLQFVKAVDPATMAQVVAVKTRYGMKENPFTSPIARRNENSFFRKFKVQNF